MRYVWNGGVTDARVNLALEEYVLRHFRGDDEYLLFYVNEPAVILGRNQSSVEEIDSRAAARRGVRVVRRMSGGGAVYHDRGNLNFSFVTPYAPERFNRYDVVTRPILDTLRDLGVPAVFGGRNDIVVDGRKISGNAQFVADERMFSHGTLLVDSALEDMTRVLRPRPGKVESKGAKSVRGRVANLREYLAEPVPVDRLRRQILKRVLGDDAVEATRYLTPAEWRDVIDLANRKYGAWGWNHGESPAFTMRRTHRFSRGEVDARITVERGYITNVRLIGDYLGRLTVEAVEARLVGLPHDAGALREALAPLTVEEHLGGITTDELVGLLTE